MPYSGVLPHQKEAKLVCKRTKQPSPQTSYLPTPNLITNPPSINKCTLSLIPCESKTSPPFPSKALRQNGHDSYVAANYSERFWALSGGGLLLIFRPSDGRHACSN
ncbi:hypothetical protein AVEN_259378-1 [Araneus ventricosus]|uniref:Uncharacterized protein n=1 Tax=Araneus ventricosus TaxID=182803 RepID=A0A4Y2DTP5_ARAVE|nr:hypothetical protein AVEN_259378-1 [Araneus ventricosus]